MTGGKNSRMIFHLFFSIHPGRENALFHKYVVVEKTMSRIKDYYLLNERRSGAEGSNTVAPDIVFCPLTSQALCNLIHCS